MPIYEYKCESCGKHFDFLAKRLTHTPDACPEAITTSISLSRLRL